MGNKIIPSGLTTKRLLRCNWNSKGREAFWVRTVSGHLVGAGTHRGQGGWENEARMLLYFEVQLPLKSNQYIFYASEAPIYRLSPAGAALQRGLLYETECWQILTERSDFSAALSFPPCALKRPTWLPHELCCIHLDLCHGYRLPLRNTNRDSFRSGFSKIIYKTGPLWLWLFLLKGIFRGF